MNEADDPRPADTAPRAAESRAERVARLTRRFNVGPGDAARDRLWELTVELIRSEDARRTLEARLEKAQARNRLFAAGSQAPASDNGAVESAQRELSTARQRLHETEQALAEARDRAEGLERKLRHERETRERIEQELETSRARLQEASTLLKEIEEAYMSSRGMGPPGAPGAPHHGP